jgi:glycosyltransferase involved in cell wall biosynthesis
VHDFAHRAPQRIRYEFQDNQGAYAARNRGLDLATGEYVAFFDSDDEWLPHHLAACVQCLEDNGEVDWVFAAWREVDASDGRVYVQNSFYPGGKPRPFFELKVRANRHLRIIDDSRLVRYMILDQFYVGLQKSVVRRNIFSPHRFRPVRNGDDTIFPILRATEGCQFAYLDNVHVIYKRHLGNSCCSSLDVSPGKHLQIYQSLATGLESLRVRADLTAAERQALVKRLGAIYFWQFGYNYHLFQREWAKALSAMSHGLRLHPWSPREWKTFLAAPLRMLLMQWGLVKG